jgi:hypothetical protein
MLNYLWLLCERLLSGACGNKIEEVNSYQAARKNQTVDKSIVKRS